MTTERSVVWAEWGGKIRLCIVLRSRPGVAWLVPVTGTERPWMRHVRVARKSRAGRALRLTKPTYFYSANVFLAAADKLLPAEGRTCPPELFRELLPLAPPNLEAYVAGWRR